MKKIALVIFITAFALIISCDFSAPRTNSNDPKVMSDAEAVAADKSSLSIGYTDEDNADSVTQDVELATSGISGTTISWESSNSLRIINSGDVIRPGYGSGDSNVTLTATISRGSISNTKPFTLKVKALSLICAATADGLSYSSDGTSWQNKKTVDGMSGNFVKGVYSPTTNIYAATSTGLTVVSNGGTTYTKYLESEYVNSAYYNSIIYAATNNGLAYKTKTAWSFYTTANNLGSNTVYAVRVVVCTWPETTTTLYAATAGGLSYFTIGDAKWTNRTTADGLGSNIVYGLHVVGSLFRTIYAATNGGVSISTNGGSSWTNYTVAANGLANNKVNGVYYSNPAIYAATQGGLSRSTNGGTSWETLNTGAGLTVYGVYAAGSTIYAATSNGMAISTNYGVGWDVYTTLDGLGHNTVYGVSAK
jgi:hypothetical protein